MKEWWKDEYDAHLESIFDRMDTPIRYITTFITGVLVGVIWMLMQR